MKQKFVFTSLAVLLAIAISLTAVQSYWSSSVPPPGNSGAPGDGNCTGCHSGTPNAGPGSVTIGAPASYVPGSTYNITVTVAETGVTKFGFQVTALDGSNNMAGTLIAGVGSMLQTGTRDYVNHAMMYVTFSNSHTWTFQWTAPSTSVGPVTFYAVGNATNSNGSSSGDHIYTTSQTVAPFAASFYPSSFTICSGDTITFNSTSTGAITYYLWHFDYQNSMPGGVHILGQTPGVDSIIGLGPHQVIYTSPYTVPVTIPVYLLVSDFPSADVDTETVMITINPTPTPSVFLSQSPACNGYVDTIVCTNYPGATYNWNFGGGTVLSGSGSGPYHVVWNTNGSTNVSVSVTTALGCTGASGPVAVTVQTCNPTADFTISDTTACVGQVITFTNTSTAGSYPINYYNWDFTGTGTPSTSSTPTQNATFSTPGTYPITFVAGSNGYYDTIVKNIHVNANPPATITATALTICKLTTDTISCNTVPGATYSWNFGSATVTSGSGAGLYEMNWTASGLQGVSVTITNPLGCFSTDSVTINVGACTGAPTASFSASSLSMCQGQIDTFTDMSLQGVNPIANWVWSFPGGVPSSSTTPGPQYIYYAVPGSYPVTLIVNDGGTLADTFTTNVVINPCVAPVANFSISDTSGCVGVPLTFYDLSTSVAPPTTYLWIFGPNATPSTSSTSGNQIATFNTAGNDTVTLIVHDQNGTNSISIPITISAAPNPAVTFTPSTVCVGANATLSSNTFINASYAWNLSGGTIVTGTGAGPLQVTWPTTGLAQVSVTVTDSNGCPGTSIPVTISVINCAVPQANFSMPQIGCTGQAVTIQNLTTGTVTNYSWAFGGGSPSSATTSGPHVVTFNTPGQHIVTLTASNGAGSTTFSDTIDITQAPTSSFTVVSPVCVGINTNIIYTGSGLPTSTYNWNFVAGTIVSGTGIGPYQVNWSLAGNKNIALQVTENGCSSGITTNVVVVNNVPFSIYQYATTNQTVSFTNHSTGANSYQWDFGDGSPVVTTTNAIHQYSTGNWQACLTAFYSTCVDIYCQNLTIYELGADHIDGSDGFMTVFTGGNEMLNIGWQNVEAEKLSVFDMSGRQVISQELYTGNNHLELSTSGFSSGMYFVQLQTKQGIMLRKWVK